MTKKQIDALVFSTMLFVLALSPALSAQQQQPEPKPLRFDFTPFVGYRTGMSFPIEPHVTGTNPHFALDARPSYGVSFGVRLEEDGFVEIRWARQDSYIHSDDFSVPVPRKRVTLDQFHADFSREYVVDEWRPWARPFVLLGLGATRISNGAELHFTRFSFGIGGGLRFYPTRHLGFKIQAEWLPILVNPQVAFVCGSGCIIHMRSSVTSQGEVVVGPVLRF
jgi:hypothetical protein